MSQHKYYNYYITDEATASAMKERYATEVEGKRKALQEKLLDDTGAIAWTESSNWGCSASIVCLVYPRDHEIVKASHIKKPEYREYEGNMCALVRGKANSKAGKEFNRVINDVNAALKDLPNYKNWLVKEFDVMTTSIGGPHESGRGSAMLSTDGGKIGNVLGFAIPNNEKMPVIPECFTQITYGKWYDMLNDD